MLTTLKKALFANLGAKAIALALALIVWGLVSGRVKAASEQSINVRVDVSGIPGNIEVQSINPPEVRLTLRSRGGFPSSFRPEQLRLEIGLQGTARGGRLSFYAEDFLELPPGIEVVSLHPKRIELILEELVSREVPVRPYLTGRLPAGLKLAAVRCLPEKAIVFGYRAQVEALSHVQTQEINLGAVAASTTVRVGLRQPASVLKFLERKEVEVTLEIGGKAQEGK